MLLRSTGLLEELAITVIMRDALVVYNISGTEMFKLTYANF